MEKLFFSVLHMSLITSYITICVIIARFFLKKAPKIFSYLLWSVVFLRLICPFSPESTVSLIPKQVSEPVISTAVLNNNNPGDKITANRNYQPVPVNNNNNNDYKISGSDRINMAPAWNFIFSIIWFSVVITLICYNLWSTVRLKHKLNSAGNIRNNIYEGMNIDTPFVFGIIKPKIYLPIGIEETETDYIIRHEQIHIQRKDYLVKYIAYIITCIHWFNPFIWFAFILMCRDMEMSCDEQVLKEFGSQIKKAYSNSLLSNSIGKKIMTGVPLAFGKNATKDRIRNVLHYKKPTVVKIILPLFTVLLICGGFSVNPAKANNKYDNYKEKKQPVALNDFVIANDQLSLKNGKRVNVKLVMVKGEYFDMEYAGAGGGISDENYQGDYELQVYSETNLISKLNIGKHIFGNKFDIVFGDYNRDGNMDFTIGEWGSSSMNLYRLYTIHENGTITEISPADMIAVNKKEYSILLQHDDNGTITVETYNNAKGINEPKSYLWNGKTGKYEEETDTYGIDDTEDTDNNETEDAEFMSRLRSVSFKDMDNAKRTSEEGWETGLCLLEELPEDNIYMYGYNDSDYQFRGIIIRIGYQINYFDWTYSSPATDMFQMYYNDFDNDGTNELAVTLYYGGGTGISITNLYVLEPGNSGTLIPYQFTPEDYIAQINKRMSYKVDQKKKKIELYDGKRKLREADLSWLDGANVNGVYYGTMVWFDLGKQLMMRIAPGMEIDDWASLQYDGLDELKVAISYKDGVFQVLTIE